MDQRTNTPESGRPAAAAGGIQVISRAAKILRTLRDEAEGLSLAQIAQRVELPRSTVQRIVTALAAERLLIAASPGARVRLGPEILALAASSKVETIELVHPHLKALSEETGETVDLAVFRKDHVVFVDQVAGSQRLRAVSAVGETFPLDSTANGKACLAMLGDGEIEASLRAVLERGLRQRGRSLPALLRELREVRRTGIAYDNQEHSQGISALGTAFRDGTGSIYAISVPAPTGRFDENRAELAERLLAKRRIIVGLLGSEG